MLSFSKYLLISLVKHNHNSLTDRDLKFIEASYIALFSVLQVQVLHTWCTLATAHWFPVASAWVTHSTHENGTDGPQLPTDDTQ